MNTIPKDMYLDGVQHSDFNCGEPEQIVKWILVSHYGHSNIDLVINGKVNGITIESDIIVPPCII